MTQEETVSDKCVSPVVVIDEEDDDSLVVSSKKDKRKNIHFLFV
jgi:hypothetical protein